MPFLLPTPHGYYFRIVVPSDLRQALGKREIKKSLGTYDPKSASLIAIQYANKYRLLFQTLRGKEKAMSLDDFYKTTGNLIIKNGLVQKDGTISFDSIELDPNHPEEEKMLLNTFLNRNEDFSNSKNSNNRFMLLSELIEEYSNDKLANGKWVEGTYDENKSLFDMFLEIFGDVDISSIKKKDSQKFISILKLLNKRRTNLNELKSLNLDELTKRYSNPTLSPKTINIACGKISSVFKYAVENGYININYFAKLGIEDNRPDHELRKPFSEDHLCKLFATEIYQENKWLHPHYYWAPLIAFYAGLRLEEICQLHISDIIFKDGIWTIDVNTRDGKQLKSKSSRRFVPIHSKLIELGLINYVDLLKLQDHIKLFPYLTKVKNKYGRKVSDWFTGYRKKHGVNSDDGTLVFHSFRHNFINYFKQSEVKKEIINALAGHKEDNIDMNLYGKPYEMNVTSKYIETLSLPKEITIDKFNLKKVRNYPI